MPIIKAKAKAKAKKPVKSAKKPVTRSLVPAKTKSKNTLAYFQCMSACCQKKQRISQTAHECKTNALAINAKMSATKTKAAKKIKQGYETLGQGLRDFIKA
jgi:hypothetical protein